MPFALLPKYFANLLTAIYLVTFLVRLFAPLILACTNIPPISSNITVAEPATTIIPITILTIAKRI